MLFVVVIIIPIGVKACARGWCENKKERSVSCTHDTAVAEHRVLGLSLLQKPDERSRIVLRTYGTSLARAVVIWHTGGRVGSVRLTVVWVKYFYYYYTHTAINTQQSRRYSPTTYRVSE